MAAGRGDRQRRPLRKYDTAPDRPSDTARSHGIRDSPKSAQIAGKAQQDRSTRLVRTRRERGAERSTNTLVLGQTPEPLDGLGNLHPPRTGAKTMPATLE